MSWGDVVCNGSVLESAGTVRNCHMPAQRPVRALLDEPAVAMLNAVRLAAQQRNRRLLPLHRDPLGDASGQPRNGGATGQIRHCGDRGVQISASSSIRAELKSPMRLRGRISSARLQSRPAPCVLSRIGFDLSSRRRTRVTLASRIGTVPAEGDGTNRASGVSANACEGLQLHHVIGQFAVVVTDDLPGTSQKIAGPAVVAQPRQSRSTSCSSAAARSAMPGNVK